MASNEAIYGKKPIVPDAPNYVASLKKTVAGNIDLIPSLSELATKSTKLYSDLEETASPGATARNAKVGSVIDDWLAGKVPKDVQRQLSIYGAERASQTGVGGSIGDAWTAKDFGDTSGEYQMRGVTAAMRWQQQSRRGIFDFSKMFLGPDDAEKQAESTFNRNWLAAQVEGAPDPVARGHHDSNLGIWGMAMGAYSGGPGYTQAYHPNYGNAGASGGGGGGGVYQGGTGQSYFGDSYQYPDQGTSGAPWTESGDMGAGAGEVAGGAAAGAEFSPAEFGI